MTLATLRFSWNGSERVFMAGALRAISFMDEVKLKAKLHRVCQAWMPMLSKFWNPAQQMRLRQLDW